MNFPTTSSMGYDTTIASVGEGEDLAEILLPGGDAQGDVHKVIRCANTHWNQTSTF